VIEYLKLFAVWINSAKTMFVFGAVAGTALFLPACWLETLHLSAAIEHYRPFLWLVFSVCLMGLVFDGSKAIGARQKTKSRLRHLARDEQEFLSHFVHNHVSTMQVLVFEAGPATSLTTDGILFLSPTIGDVALDKAVLYFMIKPWILRYLSKHATKCLGRFATCTPITPEQDAGISN
jgi:Super-infection exclusion protein B